MNWNIEFIGGELPWRLSLGAEPWGSFTSEADARLFRDAIAPPTPTHNQE